MASEGGSKVWLLLVGAIGFGLVAAIFSAVYLKSREEAIRQRLEGDRLQNVQVVVAGENMPKGTQISRGAFAIREMPSEYIHGSAIYPEYFEAHSHRFLAEDLGAGRPLLESFLVDEFPVDFSDLIEVGLRALTISVDDESSQAAMMRPGDKIDLFVNIPVRESGLAAPPIDEAAIQNLIAAPSWLKVAERVRQIPPSDIMMPVVQDVTVLATGREPYEANLDALNLPQQRQDLRYATLTVAVASKQAAAIRIAEDKGELFAFLRNRDDRSVADYIGITPQQLFQAATQMAAEAKLRAAAAAAGATIDKDGNWVTADGQVINKEDLVVSEDGTVTTKSGKLLAKEGMTINENGEYVDENGNVIKPENVVIQTADGRFVDANGNEIPADELVVGPDGTVKTKDQIMAEAGFTINENGDYVDADGNVISKDDIVILANGTVMTKDGKVLAGPPVTVNDQGFIIAADGTVMTPDGKVLSGLRVNEKGEVIGPDGQVLHAKDLIVAADGSVRTKDGKLLAGVSAATTGSVVADAAAFDDPGSVDLIIGGASEDGVAKVTVLPISQ